MAASEMTHVRIDEPAGPARSSAGRLYWLSAVIAFPALNGVVYAIAADNGWGRGTGFPLGIGLVLGEWLALVALLRRRKPLSPTTVLLTLAVLLASSAALLLVLTLASVASSPDST